MVTSRRVAHAVVLGAGILVTSVGGFQTGVAPFGRTGVVAFGRSRKGNLQNELAGISKPQDPDKKKKKKKGGKKASGGAELVAPGEFDAEQAANGDGVLEPVELEEFDQSNPLQLPPEVKSGDQVLDPVSKKAYFLPLDEPSRMAACFPRPSEASREKYRLNWGPSIGHEEVVEAMAAADAEGFEAMREFVVANHDHLGYRAALLLTGLKMNAQYRKDKPSQEKYESLRRSFVLADQSVSVPLRQLVREAEGRLGPIAQSGDPKAFKALTSLGASEVNGLWVLIKAAVATWSDKAMFANEKIAKIQKSAERTNDMEVQQQEKDRDAALGSLQVWSNLADAFMEDRGFTDKLRPELKFIDVAAKLETETEVRKYAAQTFCPESGMELAELREAVRYFRNSVQRLSPQNYGGLADLITGMAEILCAGAPEEVDVYTKATRAKATFFETYELPGNSKLHELETIARSREDEKNYGPAAALQKNVMAKRPDNLDWANEQNSKQMVDEVADFFNEDKDMTLMDPANFPDVKEVAVELDKLRAEFRRQKKAASGLVGMGSEADERPAPTNMEDYIAQCTALLDSSELTESTELKPGEFKGPNPELDYAPLPKIK